MSTPEQIAYGKAYRQRPEARAAERARSRRRERDDPGIARKRNHRRRARMLNAFVEHVEPLVLLEMDDGVCGICGADVDPFDFHMDHIVPLSRGGLHSYLNMQVAHPGCNVRKSNRHPDTRLLPQTPAGTRSERVRQRDGLIVALLERDLTYAEVAEALGVSRRTVSARVSAMRAAGLTPPTRKQGQRRDPARNGWDTRLVTREINPNRRAA